MIRINLLKPETKEIREVSSPGTPEFKAEKKKPSGGSLIFLVLVLTLIGFFWVQKRAMDNEKGLLEKARAEKQQLSYVTARLEELSKQKASLELKINLINSLKSQQDLAIRIIDTVSRCLPEWVWLTEASYDAKKITLKGKAISNNLIADYITNLETSDVFKNVNLVASTLRKNQKTEFLEFGLNMSLERPEPVPVVPAAKAKPAARKGGGR